MGWAGPPRILTMTAMTITSYKNGDMVGQRYLTKIAYNVPAEPSQFDIEILVKKK